MEGSNHRGRGSVGTALRAARRCVLTVAGVAAIVAACAASVAHSDAGREALLGQLGARLGADIDAERMRWSFDEGIGVRLDGVRVEGLEGFEELRADEIYARATLPGLLGRVLVLEEVEVEGGHIEMHIEPGGESRRASASGRADHGTTRGRGAHAVSDRERAGGPAAVESALASASEAVSALGDRMVERLAARDVRALVVRRVRIRGTGLAVEVEGVGRFASAEIGEARGALTLSGEARVVSVDRLGAARVDVDLAAELLGGMRERDWSMRLDGFEVEDWRWAGEGFSVSGARARLSGQRVEVAGWMRFPGRAGRPSMEYAASARLEGRGAFDPLAYVPGAGAPRLEGTEAWASVAGSSESLRGEWSLRARALEVAGARIERPAWRGSFEDARLVAEGGSAEGSFGRVALREGFWDLGSTRFEATAELDGLRVAAPTGRGAATRDARWDGLVRVEGDVAARRLEIDALGDLVMTPLEGRAVRVTPGARATVEGDRVEVREARLSRGADRLYVERASYDRRRSVFEALEVDASLAGVSVRPPGSAVEVRGRAVRVSLAARGPFDALQGRIDAIVRSPEVRGPGGRRFAADRFSFAARLTGGRRVEVREARLETPHGDIAARGSIAPGCGSCWLAIDYEIESVELASLVEELTSQMGLVPTVELGGSARAEGEVRGSLARPRTTVEVEIAGGEIAGRSLPSATASASMRGGRVSVERLAVDAGRGGHLEARGGFDAWEGGAFALDLEIAGAEIGSWRQLERYLQVPLGGRAELAVRGRGSFDVPEWSGALRVESFDAGAGALGDLEIGFETIGTSLMLVGGMPSLFTVDGEVPLDGRRAMRMGLHVDRLRPLETLRRLDPAMARRIEAQGNLGALSTSGTIELTVPSDLRGWTMEGRFSDLSFEIDGEPIRNGEPIVVHYGDSRPVHIEHFTLGARRRYLRARGDFDPRRRYVDLAIDGDVDLGIVRALKIFLVPELRHSLVASRGSASLTANIEGRPGSIRTEGEVQIDASEFRFRDMRGALAVDAGRVRFDQGGLWIEGGRAAILDGRLDGQFEVSGRVDFVDGRPRSMEVDVRGDRMSVDLIEHARVRFDSALKLNSPDVSNVSTWGVSGEVHLLEGAVDQRNFAFQRSFLTRIFSPRGSSRSVGSPVPGGLREIALDIDVRPRDSVFVFMHEIPLVPLGLQMLVDLELGGTLSRPEPRGIMEVVGMEIAPSARAESPGEK